MTAPAPAFLPLVLAPDDVPPQPWPGPPPVVAVYGDSFTSGTGYGGLGPANWTVLVRDRLRLNLANDAVSGSAYVRVLAGLHSSFPYAAAVWPVPDAAVVLLFGGVNDSQQDPNAVGMQATVQIAVARAGSPRAQIVVVAPQWPATPPTANLLAIRDQVAAAAQQPGVTYVDPSGWFQGHPDLIASDGLHPTDRGHAYLADRLAPIIADALQRAGIPT